MSETACGKRAVEPQKRILDRKHRPPATAGGADSLAEGTGLEPASDQCAVVFGTTALPVRLPFQTFSIAD